MRITLLLTAWLGCLGLAACAMTTAAAAVAAEDEDELRQVSFWLDRAEAEIRRLDDPAARGLFMAEIAIQRARRGDIDGYHRALADVREALGDSDPAILDRTQTGAAWFILIHRAKEGDFDSARRWATDHLPPGQLADALRVVKVLEAPPGEIQSVLDAADPEERPLLLDKITFILPPRSRIEEAWAVTRTIDDPRQRKRARTRIRISQISQLTWAGDYQGAWEAIQTTPDGEAADEDERLHGYAEMAMWLPDELEILLETLRRLGDFDEFRERHPFAAEWLLDQIMMAHAQAGDYEAAREVIARGESAERRTFASHHLIRIMAQAGDIQAAEAEMDRLPEEDRQKADRLIQAYGHGRQQEVIQQIKEDMAADDLSPETAALLDVELARQFDPDALPAAHLAHLQATDSPDRKLEAARRAAWLHLDADDLPALLQHIRSMPDPVDRAAAYLGAGYHLKVQTED